MSNASKWLTAIQNGAYRVATSDSDLPETAEKVGEMGGYNVYETDDGPLLKQRGHGQSNGEGEI
ncbi:hypothetical protein [Haladaptatus salinisoli]|uniref:hypothetical protein n=1 Tax=Haladaptatus salinisoli TaxID=2884876 RepID=UPI001D0A52BA|nr:hypothetical protein [Haladaptatus salinisoli]